MSWFFKKFLLMLLSRPIVRAVDWTRDERNAFDAFCRSSCGVKLFEYLRQVVARNTFTAVYQLEVSANAYARGQQDVLVLFHRLRVFPSEEESKALSEQELVRAAQGIMPDEEKPDSWRWIGGRGAIG